MKMDKLHTGFLNKDSNTLGILIGLLVPVLFFGILLLLNMLIINVFKLDMFMRYSTIKLLSIVINVFPIRYYFVKRRLDQTGRGVLLVTFVYFVVYFWLVL